MTICMESNLGLFIIKVLAPSQESEEWEMENMEQNKCVYDRF